MALAEQGEGAQAAIAMHAGSVRQDTLPPYLLSGQTRIAPSLNKIPLRTSIPERNFHGFLLYPGDDIFCKRLGFSRIPRRGHRHLVVDDALQEMFNLVHKPSPFQVGLPGLGYGSFQVFWTPSPKKRNSEKASISMEALPPCKA